MNPVLQIKTKVDDLLLNELHGVIHCIDCKDYFLKHIGKNQSEQKDLVSNFQSKLLTNLREVVKFVEWQKEYSPSEARDAIDIYGQTTDLVVVIELDKHRADQIAKKFVSRMAMFNNTKVYYISLCYPGTKSMSKTEAVKYFGYCANLAERMGNVYAGFIIE